MEVLLLRMLPSLLSSPPAPVTPPAPNTVTAPAFLVAPAPAPISITVPALLAAPGLLAAPALVPEKTATAIPTTQASPAATSPSSRIWAAANAYFGEEPDEGHALIHFEHLCSQSLGPCAWLYFCYRPGLWRCNNSCA
jgi:hypothetical protein